MGVARVSDGSLTRITDINLCGDFTCKWYMKSHQVMTTFKTYTCLSRNSTFMVLIYTHTKFKSMKNILRGLYVNLIRKPIDYIFIWVIVCLWWQNIPVLSVKDDTTHTTLTYSMHAKKMYILQKYYKNHITKFPHANILCFLFISIPVSNIVTWKRFPAGCST